MIGGDFEAAIEAHSRESLKNAEEIADFLLRWAFEAGRHEVGWAIRSAPFMALGTLALLEARSDKRGRAWRAKSAST